MPTQEIHLSFWKELCKRDASLFNGTPSKQHYFDITLDNGFIIRLDIYIGPKEYRTKGTQTIALILDRKRKSSIIKIFRRNNNHIFLYDKGIVFQISNGKVTSPITENETSWEPYIIWFREYTKKIKEQLDSWQNSNTGLSK